MDALTFFTFSGSWREENRDAIERHGQAAKVAAMGRGVAHGDAERWIVDGWGKVVQRFGERLNKMGVY